MSAEHGRKPLSENETKNKNESFTRLGIYDKEGSSDFYQAERVGLSQRLYNGKEKIKALGKRLKEKWDKHSQRHRSFKLSSIDSRAYEDEKHFLHSRLDKASKAEKRFNEIAREGEKLSKDKKDVENIEGEVEKRKIITDEKQERNIKAVKEVIKKGEPVIKVDGFIKSVESLKTSNQGSIESKKAKTEAQKRLSDVAEVFDKYPVLKFDVKILNQENPHSKKGSLTEALENGNPPASWLKAAEKSIKDRLSVLESSSSNGKEYKDLEKALKILAEAASETRDIKKDKGEKLVAQILTKYRPQYYKTPNVEDMARKFEAGAYSKADASRALGALGYIKLNNKSISGEDMTQLLEAENFLVKVANRIKEPNRTEVPVLKREDNEVKVKEKAEKAKTQTAPEQQKPKTMAARGGR